jgi:hypothetical protein
MLALKMKDNIGLKLKDRRNGSSSIYDDFKQSIPGKSIFPFKISGAAFWKTDFDSAGRCG